ncbi:MAG TPA: multidrug effflux MFS transporter [Chitinophagaceae bacterium]
MKNYERHTTKNKTVEVKTVKQNSVLIILILGALSTVSPFSIDMYLPAFSQIAGDFHVRPARISYSITSYFAGLAIGQMLYGPLLDRFGRKRPLYCGLILYIVCCIGCLQSRSVEMLVAFRFVQALGGCVAQVAAITMVRDFFPVKESAKVLSLLILIIGLSPLLAPTIGGFISTGLGWHWVFIVLAILVLLIMAITFFFLPEKHKPDASVSLRIEPMTATFLSILKTPSFYTYTLAGSFSFAVLFIYVAGSPIIFMQSFHVSAKEYGAIFALLSVGFIGGNQLNIFLLRKYRSEQILRVALFAQVITCLVFLVGALNGWFGLSMTIAMFFICLSCIGFTYPNACALALAAFTRNVGSASALLGFLQMGIGGIISSGVGIFNSSNSIPVVAIMASASVIALLILIAGKRAAAVKAIA